MKFLGLVLFIFSSIYMFGQIPEWKTVQTDTFSIDSKSYKLSKKFPLPSSIKVNTPSSSSPIPFEYNSKNSELILLQSPSSDSIIIVWYRFYDINVKDTLYATNYKQLNYDDIFIGYIDPLYSTREEKTPNALTYNGTFGRALSAGNNQSIVLNSNFNLQLQGEIGNGINIQAVLSDADIPIQAEGNTQQLNEFDQVYIEIQKDEHKLVAGDIRLQSPNDYFIKYIKKLKGVQYQNSAVDVPGGKLSLKSSLAIAGGKFNRQSINPIEGNQGPYKLKGNNNESFIIIQSGTEKVYIDGVLMKRGENYDYVISYNNSEIRFTENRPINSNNRIIIEFEYLAQNYAQNIMAQEFDYRLENHHISFNMYREQDQKNSSGNLQLSDQERAILTEAGEDSTKYIIRSVYPIENFTRDRAYYQKIYDPDIQDTILIYSENPTQHDFIANFSDVGQGNGTYAIDDSFNVNSRVYKYVGDYKGRYAPIKVLIPPVSKSMYSLSERWHYKPEGSLRLELGLSQIDRNLFSPLDHEDNVGGGFRMDWMHSLHLKKNENTKKIPLTIKMFAEYSSKHFKTLNPYRPQEFKRDWNLRDYQYKRQEWWTGATVKSPLHKRGVISYDINILNINNFYEGYRHSVTLNHQSKYVDILSNTSYLYSTDHFKNTQFLRPNVNLQKLISNRYGLKVGLNYEAEYNIQEDIITDTLLQNSYEFDQFSFYFKNDDKRKLQYNLSIIKRFDRHILDDLISDFSESTDYKSSINWQNEKHQLEITSTYRIFELNESFMSPLRSTNTLLGGLNYQYILFGRKLIGNTNIDINTGQEPKLEYEYRKVIKGEGNYIWIDDGDGIKEKDEFQLAIYADQGDHIRIRLYNNEFIYVFKQEINQSLRWNPNEWKTSKSKLLKKLSNISSLHTFRFSRKDKLTEGFPPIFQFQNPKENPDNVSYITALNNQVFWNRGNSKIGGQLDYQVSNRLVVLTTGRELKERRKYQIQIRKGFLRKFDWRINLKRLDDANNNLVFTKNNYKIVAYHLGSLLDIRLKQNLSFNVNYSKIFKTNESSIESQKSDDITIECQYSQKSIMRITGHLSYKRIEYKSNANQTIDFIMLDGLKAGNNFIWNLQFTRRIYSNFDLIVSYNGRKSENSRTIHTGTAQIRATF